MHPDFCRWLICGLFAALQFAALHAQSLTPGDSRRDLQTTALVRSYLLHVPTQVAASSSPAPLLIALHGGGGNAYQFKQDSQLDQLADRAGLVVAYPFGTGKLKDRLLTWNAGHCCGHAQEEGVDDVGFISALIDTLLRTGAVDRNRVYVVGHSNGGMMAHRAGAALPDKVAAIVSVAGAYIPEAGAALGAVPVLHVHSVDDPRAPYGGGLGPPFPFTNSRVMHEGVDATLAAWARRDGCGATPEVQQKAEAGGHTAQHWVWPHCRQGVSVELWKLTGAGHGWPGAPARMERILGPNTHVIDANAEIWRFVSRFRLATPG